MILIDMQTLDRAKCFVKQHYTTIKIPRLFLREDTLGFRVLIVRLEKSLIVCLAKSGPDSLNEFID